MSASARLSLAIPLVGLALAAPVRADLATLAKCQKTFAKEGAKFALRVLKSNLKCTDEISECQLGCELGQFGPSCDESPPPCCDPDDTGSNAGFAACMSAAQETCDSESARRTIYESSKQERITSACETLTQDELCGAQSEGLNFAMLNAGCFVLDPSYTCTLANLIGCVGGPLEQALLEQITTVLHPRASDAVAAAHVESQFPDLPIARKVKGAVAAGKVDVWEFSGREGDAILARVNVREDDVPTGVSSLHPVLTLLDGSNAPVADTNVRSFECAVPNVCATGCPVLKRTLPFDGTFRLAVGAFTGDACGGGNYKLTLISPGGAPLAKVADDVDPFP